MTSDVIANRRRLALCRAPLFPGSPSEYRYQPERCIQLAQKKKNSNPSRTNAKRAQRVLDRIELSALGSVTGTWNQGPLVMPADPTMAEDILDVLEAKDTVIVQTFRSMISHALRTRFPNPVKRIAHLQRTDSILGPKMKLVVRYRVFLLVEAHLTEVLAMDAH